MIPKIVIFKTRCDRDGICGSCGNQRNLDCPYNRLYLYSQDSLHIFRNDYLYVMKETFKGILFFSDENNFINDLMNRNKYEEVVFCPWYRKGLFIINIEKWW